MGSAPPTSDYSSSRRATIGRAHRAACRKEGSRDRHGEQHRWRLRWSLGRPSDAEEQGSQHTPYGRDIPSAPNSAPTSASARARLVIMPGTIAGGAPRRQADPICARFAVTRYDSTPYKPHSCQKQCQHRRSRQEFPSGNAAARGAGQHLVHSAHRGNGSGLTARTALRTVPETFAGSVERPHRPGCASARRAASATASIRRRPGHRSICVRLNCRQYCRQHRRS